MTQEGKGDTSTSSLENEAWPCMVWRSKLVAPISAKHDMSMAYLLVGDLQEVDNHIVNTHVAEQTLPVVLDLVVMRCQQLDKNAENLQGTHGQQPRRQ